ncbi:uncharacterized protein METZ01_LOCUS79198 [marine metagenome]|uniref:Uncharacterized protein n=1 Tax=marine metagenome TaxID=408172 RepID=A0A381UEF3_9ZZZZ
MAFSPGELIIQDSLEFGLVVLLFGDATLNRDSIASFCSSHISLRYQMIKICFMATHLLPVSGILSALVRPALKFWFAIK